MTRRLRLLVGASAVGIVTLVLVIVVVAVDGEMYERWIGAKELQRFRTDWDKGNRPAIQSWKPYTWEARRGQITADTNVYHTPVRDFTALLSYIDDNKKHRLVITADGDLLVVHADGTARTLWMHPSRAAAW